MITGSTEAKGMPRFDAQTLEAAFEKQETRQALNFTQAAAPLRVAQPALSRQVQDLEHEIRVDLLCPSPRGVTLTAEALSGRIARVVEADEYLRRATILS